MSVDILFKVADSVTYSRFLDRMSPGCSACIGELFNTDDANEYTDLRCRVYRDHDEGNYKVVTSS
jgi:hypothetical protein